MSRLSLKPICKWNACTLAYRSAFSAETVVSNRSAHLVLDFWCAHLPGRGAWKKTWPLPDGTNTLQPPYKRPCGSLKALTYLQQALQPSAC